MKKFTLLLILIISIYLFKTGLATSQTSCPNISSNKGTVAFSTTSTAGDYRIWTRMKAADSNNNSLYLKIDSSCAILVGDSSQISSTNWTWVDYKEGNVSNKINATLSTGTHVITLYGNEPGVGVDAILLTKNLSCIPTGFGDNCPEELVTLTPIPPSNACGSSRYDTGVLADHPVGYWQLGDNNTVAQDCSTVKSHSGIYVASPNTTTLPNGDKAKVFDGTIQYAEIPDSDDLSITKTGILTIEAWIRPDVLQFPKQESSGYVNWLGKGISGQQEYAARIYSLTNWENRPNRISGYGFNLSGGSGVGSYFEDQVSVGQWIHYTLVINNKDISLNYPRGYTKIYKNGLLRDQDSLSAFSIIPGNGSAPLRIATRDLASIFKGAIGKVAVYSYELSNQKILDHYQKMMGASGNLTPIPTLPIGVSPTLTFTPTPTVKPTITPTKTPAPTKNPTPTVKPSSTPIPTSPPTVISNGLVVTQINSSTWWSGYCSNISIKNNNSTPVVWTVTFPVTGHIYDLWNASWSQSGSNVTANGLSWNKTIAAGATLSGIGYCSNY